MYTYLKSWAKLTGNKDRVFKNIGNKSKKYFLFLFLWHKYIVINNDIYKINPGW